MNPNLHPRVARSLLARFCARILPLSLLISMMPGSIALTATAAATSPAVPAELPRDVFIKTPTQSFNSRFYYALFQGRIWFKPNRLVTGEDKPWEPMGCDGLPCQPGNRDFPIPQAIAELSADADELTTIDDQGRFYIRTMAGPGWLSTTEWTNLNGMPKGVLQIPQRLKHKLAWSMGRRHFDVLWHEDADGNQHHVGTMGTSSIYLLDQDGYEISFTDNGLPPDLSHAVCGPERGRFKAENLQVSAGTLFVIDSAGRMYTEMNDFDLNGGTSMFITYTYTQQQRYDKPAGNEFASNLTPWRLPLPTWQRQPEIPLEGQARISKDITILQNGQGNLARELRVAGRDATGRIGYYTKALEAKEWRFQPAELKVSEDRWLTPGARAPEPPPSEDLTYIGPVRLGDQVYPVEIKDFNLRCSPAQVRILLPTGPLDLLLHTVDAWVNVSRQDPGRDGSIQLMLGTVELAADNQGDVPPALAALNRGVFQVHIGATTDAIYLYYLDGEVQGLLLRISEIPKNLKTFDYHYLFPAGSFASSRLQAAKLPPLRTLDSSLLRFDYAQLPADQLESLYHQNRQLYASLQHESDILRWSKGEAWIEAMFSIAARSLYTATGMCWWMPNGQAFCRTASDLLLSYYRIEDDLNSQASLRYDEMLKQIYLRLERYENRLRELKGPNWEPEPWPENKN